MLRENRIITKLASVLSDISAPLSDIHANPKVLVYTLGDYIYLGSSHPFNHRYFDLKVPNAVAAVPTIEYWTGTDQWIEAVDVIDETSVNGVPLSRDGILSFSVDPDESGWMADDTDDMTGTDLEDLRIFGLYWLRISYSATLTATLEINYVGHKFSEDAALEAEYPDLARNNLKNAWKPGKIDWQEQTLLAAEYIIAKLKGQKRVIQSPNQLLTWDLFEKASIHRTAMIIFKGLGDDYKELLKAATDEYNDALDIREFNVDLNADATLQPGEARNRVEVLRR